MTRAALFDLDETILDRSGSLRDFTHWQAKEILGDNSDFHAEFVERFIELDNKGMVWKDKVYKSLISEFQLTGWSVEKLLEMYLTEFCHFCKPRHGASGVVKAFRDKSFKIGLVSNGKTPFQERNFRALGFEALFDGVIVSEAVGLRKPDRAIFELACNVIGADINTSVFIGDNPVADIQGAKVAGMATIYVPLSPDKKACEFADNTFCDLNELSRQVEKLQSGFIATQLV